MKLLALRQVTRAYLSSRTFSSTGQSFVDYQNELFNEEQTKQMSDIGRIEKIIVNVEGKPYHSTLSMNKNMSTPYNVAQHVSDWMTEKSALALVNSKYWDMHRPLEEDSSICFLTFTDPEPYQVNKAFWRTCSFLLGATIQNAFSENIKVMLHSFPSPTISSGSFVHDAQLSLNDWKPEPEELQCLSAEMVKFCSKNFPIERLQVSEKLALEIFRENEFKKQHIPDIARQSDGKVTLYRVGSHIDISKGPMVGNTSFLGRCSVTAVHRIETNDGELYRFQGVALPKGLLLNHFAYKIIQDRAAKLNAKQPVQGSKAELSMLS